MKAFHFHDLKSHGSSPEASTGHLFPTEAVVAAENLSTAKRHLRTAGLSARSYRVAGATHSALVAELEPGTVAWTTADREHGNWVIGLSVDDVVEGPLWPATFHGYPLVYADRRWATTDDATSDGRRAGVSNGGERRRR
ncbi:hypothetical protein [Cellulosimicrobium marinum]|uniref:hypothetical protein n=1 Tax=Cellulosimicrobium marinum TaxID=1638992 RepID=UPI001E2C3E56|nr:hypothetical protein [Cellulosimicrobium marinum]MCB7137526.1 hypothetical protein [Cellulosimicrobium marinum]